MLWGVRVVALMSVVMQRHCCLHVLLLLLQGRHQHALSLGERSLVVKWEMLWQLLTWVVSERFLSRNGITDRLITLTLLRALRSRISTVSVCVECLHVPGLHLPHVVGLGGFASVAESANRTLLMLQLGTLVLQLQELVLQRLDILRVLYAHWHLLAGVVFEVAGALNHGRRLRDLQVKVQIA